MKKLFLLVLVACLWVSAPVLAEMKLGVKAGLGISTASVSPMSDGISKKSILGFLLAGMIESPIAQDKSVALRGEVGWAEKGVKFTSDNGSVKQTVDELVLSPFILYNIPGMIEKARPFVEAGPELGFVVSSNQHTEIDNVGTKDEDIKHISSTDFSLNLGAGVGIPLKNRGEIIAELRYCLGLSDMDDTSDGTSKLRTFFINVGYNFPAPR
jgi:opacity protein-like surface antigen